MLPHPCSPGILASLERRLSIQGYDISPFADRAGVRVGGAVLGDVPPGKQVSQLHPHADERRQETGTMRVYRNVKDVLLSIYFLQQVMIQRLNSTGHLYSTCSEVDMEQHDGCTCGCRITEADCNQSNQVREGKHTRLWGPNGTKKGIKRNSNNLAPRTL